MAQHNPIWIDIATDPQLIIVYTTDPALPNPDILTSIRKAEVLSVSKLFIPSYSIRPGYYQYPTKTVLYVLYGPDMFQCELQNVVNQSTWNTGTRVAANTAVSNIMATLP
jgi:hypothetical protein